MNKICTICGQELPETAAFCNLCGGRLEASQQLQQPPPPAQQPQPGYQPPQQQTPYQQPTPQQPQPGYQTPQPPQAGYPPVQQPYYQQQAPQQPYAQTAPQTQYYQQQGQYAAGTGTFPTGKKKSSKKMVIIAFIVLAIAIGIGAWVLLRTPNTPEGVATAWTNALLEGDIDAIIKHTVLLDEMMEYGVRQGEYSSKAEAKRNLASDLESARDYLIRMLPSNLKFDVVFIEEIFGSELDYLKYVYLYDGGDAIIDAAIERTANSITRMCFLEVIPAGSGHTDSYNEIMTLYLALVNGTWRVLLV